MFDNLLVNTNAVQVNSQECTAKAHDLDTHTVWFDHQTQPERSLCPGKKQPTGLCWLSCLQDLFESSDSGLFISNRTAKEAEEFFLIFIDCCDPECQNLQKGEAPVHMVVMVVAVGGNAEQEFMLLPQLI